MNPLKQTFQVTGMTCSACSAHVEKAVNKLEAVNKAEVSLMTNSMSVDYDPDAQTASLSLPGSRESLTVDVSNYLPFRGAEVGNQVSYTLVDGQIYCRVMIDFMATVGYEAAATAPVRWDGSQWILGEISLSTLAPN